MEGGIEAADAVAEAAGATVDNDGLEDGDEPIPSGSREAGDGDISLLEVAKPTPNPFAEMKSFMPTKAPNTVPPGPPASPANKCTKSKPDCGILHDTFASLWGEMKDLVEAKEEKMQRDELKFKKIDEGFNTQIKVMSMQMGQMQAVLAEATSNKATESDEQTQKQLESQALQKEYKKTMAACKARKEYILWTEICGVIKVRGEVLKQGSDEQKEADVTDCDVGEWIPGECSVPCDNSMKGGKERLTREVLTKNTKYGHACPALSWPKVCNAFKCPVDCKVSSWSGWSKCTKECGGGLQSMTRSLLVKPANGGEACDTLQESQPCNSFSCDRACKLKKWTRWTPCSKACGSGFQERWRHVKVPARANGGCPSKLGKARYEKRRCNTHSCVGDEQCVASMDLVIAIDGSGSVTDAGFKILKEFTLQLLERFESTAYGHEAVHASVIQFGQGKLENQIVSDAKVISPLTGKIGEVKEAVKALKWAKGFTNMAQAFLKANQLITRSPRKNAAAAMLLITDGKPSFKFQTAKAVNDLKGRARVSIVQVKSYPSQETIDLMKSYASKPWQTNYVKIPGKSALKAAYSDYAGKVLVELCPRSESPSAVAAISAQQGYRKTLEGINCGDGEVFASDSPGSCLDEANNNVDGFKAFAYGDGSCLVYKKDCSGKAMMSNATYDVYVPTA
eukprot:gnl/TRDRNA2_/TRDRNA2_138301_c1_seq1.p1 gnl/TRDRNA2_/TRDRNA2_138301_c1~~gnl/TRDRNA2_/TRDRNA2_138301_c1_seq1.p1  ORF type:complete len:680 (+),score=171.14 gnl/TRDRNA2_/TRDRNA2_138301_c1_seq1:2-2041(+)